jgi:hypothetical protein
MNSRDRKQNPKTKAVQLQSKSEWVSEQRAASEKRHFIRHPVCFPLRFKLVGENIPAEHSKTLNIGRGGLLFTAKKPVDLNKVIVLKMPFQDKVFNIRAKVVHCKKSVDGAGYNIGVCFLMVNEAFKVRLIEQMYLISEYRDLQSLHYGRELTLQEASEEWIKRYSERFKRLYW